MTLFSNNTYQGVLDRMVALFLVMSVVISVALPQKVETAEAAEETNQDIVIGLENEFHFPESETRKAGYVVQVVATSYSSDPRQTDATPCTPAMGSFDL